MTISQTLETDSNGSYSSGSWYFDVDAPVLIPSASLAHMVVVTMHICGQPWPKYLLDDSIARPPFRDMAGLSIVEDRRGYEKGGRGVTKEGGRRKKKQVSTGRRPEF